MATRTKVAIACVAAAVLLGLIATFFLVDSPGPTSSATEPIADTDPVILDVDSRGALVLVGDSLQGVTRRGNVVWSRSAASLPLSTVCAPWCPSAILSGADAGPLAPDPAPVIEGSVELPRAGWGAAGDVKNQIVAFHRGAWLRLSSTQNGSARWESAAADQVRDTPAPGTGAYWFPSSDGSAGVALVADTDQNTYVQQPFVADTQGWRALGSTSPAAAGSGCISSEGERWFVDGRTLMSATDSQPIGLRGQFGNCAFTAAHLVVSGNAVTSQGQQTVVASIDMQGKQVWREEFADEYFVTASSGADLFALMGSGSRVVNVYTGEGDRVKRFQGYSFALFDERGDLCLISPEGEVRWVTVDSEGH